MISATYDNSVRRSPAFRLCEHDTLGCPGRPRFVIEEFISLDAHPEDVAGVDVHAFRSGRVEQLVLRPDVVWVLLEWWVVGDPEVCAFAWVANRRKKGYSDT